MIVTLTANPSLDRTIELPGPLARGDVQRATAANQDPGGKGVNVCRALTGSSASSLAVLPGNDDDAVVAALRMSGIEFANLPIGANLRSNITLTEPDGTTTKVNEPGPELTPQQQRELIDLLLASAEGAQWIVLAGSLPPGVPTDFYARIIQQARLRFGSACPAIAVDTSGAPLTAVMSAGADIAPDLLKPNAEELAELTGAGTEQDLENDPSLAAAAARTLIDQGCSAVLATLGSKGAVLVTGDECWHATHAPIRARSTVGAGDSSLAGYLLASSAGAQPQDRLRQAVAHGAAAASLPGSTLPSLDQTTPAAVAIAPLALNPSKGG
ncbi:1-phosphofructokinase family hexose kinase [Arthrobacter sp. H14]|uniref:1-phosphofructokinase family hexose kinase n=1 Tax=Arthrobacter sp. H14 TaxID=1312959 RepID=UPI0004ACE327|nr:1-phosphofructokinase family hexose kinase [Arthrobacter sp. H14]